MSKPQTRLLLWLPDEKARLGQENAARKPQGFAHGLERPEVAARANDAVVLS